MRAAPESWSKYTTLTVFLNFKIQSNVLKFQYARIGPREPDSSVRHRLDPTHDDDCGIGANWKSHRLSS